MYILSLYIFPELFTGYRHINYSYSQLQDVIAACMIHLLCMLFGCFGYLNRTWWGCELHGNHQAVFSLSVPPSKANGGRMTLHQGFFLSHYIQFLWVKTQFGVYTSTSIYFQVNLQFLWVDSLINSLILSVIGEYVFQSPYSLLTPDQSLWNSDIPISARFAIYI